MRAHGHNKHRDRPPKKPLTVNSLKHVVKEIMLPRYKRLLLGLLLVLIARLASMVLPGSTKFLIDKVFLPKDLSALPLIISASVAAVFVQAISGFALVKLLGIEAQYLITELRIKIQKHVLKLPLTFFTSEKSGAVVSRIMHDVEGVRNLVGTGLVQLVGGVLTAIFSFFILLKIHFAMTLWSLLAFAVFAFVIFKAFKTIRPIFRERGKINAEVTGRLTETIGGMKVIKAFAAEENEISVFSEGVHRLYENVKKSMTSSALVSMVTLLLTGLVSAFVMFQSAHAVVNSEMSAGDFVAYLLYLGLMAFPVVQMSNIGTQLTEAFAGLDRMAELLEMPVEGKDEGRTQVMPTIKGKVEFNAVHFAYGEKQVLKGVSFVAQPGEMIALVGSSGSGKSTLVSLLATLIHPQKGNILVDDFDLGKVELRSFRSQIAMVLQDDFLFDGSIRENLVFGNPKVSEAQIQNAVKMAYVDEFTDGLEKGIDTLIGERGVKLSGGQKQRLSIARAILANPHLLILDEATSALDNQSERLVQESFANLTASRTTIVIAHRLSTIQKADKILVLEEGQIVESGTHSELISIEGRYAELHRYQGRI